MNATRDHRSSLAARLAPLLIAAGALAAGGVARAEDAAVEPPAASAAGPDPTKPADAAKPAAPAKAPATPGAKPATPSATQQRFTPSERVRADFPVSFPVDI